MPQLKGRQISSLLLSLLCSSGLQLIGWKPFNLERAACFNQSSHSNVNLIPDSLTDTLGITFGQIWAPRDLSHMAFMTNV